MRKGNPHHDESHRDDEPHPSKVLEVDPGTVDPVSDGGDIDLFEEFTELEIGMMLIEALTIG